jgi:HD-like signal output (HDOD) protein
MSEVELRKRVEACPKLASLRSIHGALADLLRNHHSQASQFAEIIGGDPSLPSRLLRMVNSVYFGLGTQVGTIEDAVLYLGLRQIRSLALATPVLEDMSAMGADGPQVSWRDFWLHTLACAFATRDLLNQSDVTIDDDTDYITGLLQNVGKVVIAKVFPAEFAQLTQSVYENEAQVLAAERALLGWDHAAIGAYYLESHKIPAEIVEAVRFHHDPLQAPARKHLAAATHLADGYARLAGLTGGVELRPAPTEDELIAAPSAALLWGDDLAARTAQMRPLADSMRRLPELVNALL